MSAIEHMIAIVDRRDHMERDEVLAARAELAALRAELKSKDAELSAAKKESRKSSFLSGFLSGIDASVLLLKQAAKDPRLGKDLDGALISELFSLAARLVEKIKESLEPQQRKESQ